MRILKFGGTSVADARRIREVVSIIRAAHAEDRVIVVVSALAGTTDRLVELTTAVADSRPAWRGLLAEVSRRHLECLSQIVGSVDAPAVRREIVTRIEEIEILCSGLELIGHCSAAVRDRLLAAGERLSAPIVAAALRAMGLDASAVDAADLIRATDTGGQVVVDLAKTTDSVREWLETADPTVIPVVTGFVAGDGAGHTLTLGRGGSDLSASVLGAAAGAARVEIWTDVSGILTAPPRQVGNAQPIPRLSYEEAAEMAFFGASVLHRDTLAPVAEHGIPVWVRNTLAPKDEGTIVSKFGARHAGATAIAALGDASVLTFERGSRFKSPVASRQLGELVACLQPEALITSQASSDQTLTVIVPKDTAQRADDLARHQPGGVESDLAYQKTNGACVVAVVGHDLRNQPRVAALALEALDRHGIRLIATASSRHSVTFALDAGILDVALEVLHEALLPSPVPVPKESCHVSPKEGRRSRRYRQRRPAVRSSVA